MSEVTPMLEQYRRIKEQFSDAIVFFRLGDFYEMFFEDATTGARELEIALTSRPAGRSGQVPMCGVPYHAAESYINRLVARGYRVAICEQLPAEGKPKLVERQVVRVVTPGTVVNDGALAPKENNYVAAVLAGEDYYGLALADVSTGEFKLGSFPRRAGALEEELTNLRPAELILPLPEEKEALKNIAGRLKINLGLYRHGLKAPEEVVIRHFGCPAEKLAAGAGPIALKAAGLLLAYLQETQKNSLDHLQPPQCYRSPTFMVLDAATRRNLELATGKHTGSREGSLLAVLDFTLTPMGGRLLRQWLEHPLVEVTDIEARHESLEELISNHLPAAELRQQLGKVRDMERLVARAVFGTATPRDLLALKESLALLPGLKNCLAQFKSSLLGRLYRDFDPLPDLTALLDSALNSQVPSSLEQGGVIKRGFNAELDQLREGRERGQEWIAGLEARERQRTGIKSLKVGYNRVFGYYLEVTKANLGLVPPDYRRKQTLANAERFVTPELQHYEELILEAEEKLIELEQRLFQELRQQVCLAARGVQSASGVVATLDCLLALAEAAVRYHYVRPTVTGGSDLIIRQGRHPVIERHLAGGEFVANDAYLDGEARRLLVITGPNMAGKSTYMRQVALIVLMAQMGSFVPAASAHIGIVDRIFTRVGATDDVVFGRSTFLMEMLECRTILEEATPRSLVVMDEVGRGTSTYDGLSLAQALLEYIHRHIGCRTLFSTHYHELTSLADSLSGVVNYTIAVEEQDGQLLFLRTVGPGRASKSYGIQVAALAGLPAAVVERAKTIIALLEAGGRSQGIVTAAACREEMAGMTSGYPGEIDGHARPGDETWKDDVLAELQRLDLVNMTPLEALNNLYALQSRVKKTS